MLINGQEIPEYLIHEDEDVVEVDSEHIKFEIKFIAPKTKSKKSRPLREVFECRAE